ELDLLGDGDTVVGDRGRAELLVQDDVAAARAQSDLDRVGERVDAVLQQVPGVVREAENLRHLQSFQAPPPWPRNNGSGRCALSVGHFSMTARTSRAESTRYSSPAYLTSVPPHSEERTVPPPSTP